MPNQIQITFSTKYLYDFVDLYGSDQSLQAAIDTVLHTKYTDLNALVTKVIKTMKHRVVNVQCNNIEIEKLKTIFNNGLKLPGTDGSLLPISSQRCKLVKYYSAFIVFCYKDKYLVQLAVKDNNTYVNIGFPGGKISSLSEQENLFGCALRELREEMYGLLTENDIEMIKENVPLKDGKYDEHNPNCDFLNYLGAKYYFIKVDDNLKEKLDFIIDNLNHRIKKVGILKKDAVDEAKKLVEKSSTEKEKIEKLEDYYSRINKLDNPETKYIIEAIKFEWLTGEEIKTYKFDELKTCAVNVESNSVYKKEFVLEVLSMKDGKVKNKDHGTNQQKSLNSKLSNKDAYVKSKRRYGNKSKQNFRNQHPKTTKRFYAMNKKIDKKPKNPTQSD